jgi:hypothetical protein
MVHIPSRNRTQWLANLCNRKALIEPFRTANPNRREYTYIPNARANSNRSRLDFYLISSCLLSCCKGSRIPHHLNSVLFEHKSVYLTFKRINNNSKQQIRDTILGDEDLSTTVRVTVYEHYLQHAEITDDFPFETKTDLLLKVGRVFTKLDQIKEIRLRIASGIDPMANDGLLVTCRTDILDLFEQLPRLDFFEQLVLSCNSVSFFETLIMSIKNVTLSQQHFFHKAKNSKKNNLQKSISELKREYITNQVTIFELENTLTELIEGDLRDELRLMRNFEQLNDEKITPYFMALAKQPSSGASLSDLCREDGTLFADSNERNNYITDYYKDVYKKDVSINVEKNIEDFLGPISNHPEVINSKLNEQEKTDLDRPLTIDEFDKSMQKAKKNTAPGIDGISNRFINTFWEFFRVPLFKFAVNCYELGTLTDNFRSAKIRLIPKKGDPTKIKNWRPISLLNGFYKIISRVIALRLQKYMDKLTRVSQKGFSSSKQCQEVLTNIVDSTY